MNRAYSRGAGCSVWCVAAWGGLAGLLLGILVSTAGAARDGVDGIFGSSLDFTRGGNGAEGTGNRPAGFSADNAIRREIAVAEGQTLSWILRDQSVAAEDAEAAAHALKRIVDLRKLRVGQRIVIVLEPRPPGAIGNRLIGVALAMPRGEAAVAFRRFDDRFDAQVANAADAGALLGSIVVVADDGARGFMSRELSLRKGDSFDSLLIRHGAETVDARAASQLLAGQVNLRRLPVGQKIYRYLRSARARLASATGGRRPRRAHRRHRRRRALAPGPARHRPDSVGRRPDSVGKRPRAAPGSDTAALDEPEAMEEAEAAVADSAVAVAARVEDAPRAAPR